MNRTKKPTPRSRLNDDIVPDDMDNKDITFTLHYIKEREDGSANCSIDMSEYVKAKLIEIGVASLLTEHIEQEAAKRKKPWWKIW